MDVLGFAYEQFTPEQREAVVIAHPRGASFKKDLIDAVYEGMKHRPDSTFGTVNDDVFDVRVALAGHRVKTPDKPRAGV